MRRWVVGVMVLLLVGCATSQTNATVQALRWQRTIWVERWQENTREGWDIPQGGTEIDSDRRQRGSERYTCGTETYTERGKIKTRTKWCSRPTYDTWYTFTIWEWTHVRDVVAHGDHTSEPHYPENRAKDINDTDPTNPERLGMRYAVNQAVMRDSSGEYPIDITDQLLFQLRPGDHLIIEKNLLGQPTGLRWPEKPKGGA
jgi:hypothetical protein